MARNIGPGEFARKPGNSCEANGGGVGAHGQLTKGPNVPSPGTKYKRSKNVFAVTSIAHSLVQPISDRVAQHFEIISKNLQFSTRQGVSWDSSFITWHLS